MKYKLLGNTGVLVSEFCLGAMTFGGKGYWKAIGELGQEEVNEIVKISYENGVNFFDTANAYSEGVSEILLGKAFNDLGISRQEIFIATKVRIRMGPGANQVGLSKYHIMDSVNDSLRRMNIDHIDLLYIHGVDPLTPLEETMRALEEVVRAGKVRYLGVSNHPAWMVMKGNSHADKMGWNKFVASQNYYTMANRDIEREILPMALSEGIAVMPWSPLAGGFLSGKFRRDNEGSEQNRRNSFDFPPINKEKAYDIIDLMDLIAREHNASVAQVALSWIKDRPGVTSVIIGVKREEQLRDNLSAVNLQLSSEETKRLDEISKLAPEYPGWMIDRQLQGRWPS